MGHTRRLSLALGSALLLAGSGAAEPVERVSIRLWERARGPALYADTSVGVARRLVPGSDLGPPAELADVPVPDLEEPAPAASVPTVTTARTVIEPPPGGEAPGNRVDLDALTGEGDDAPPSGEFLDILASLYGITAPEEVSVVWFWFQQEPADLTVASRTGNAVHRYVLSLPAEQGAGGARVADVLPAGSRGTLSTPSGLSIRSAPFGPRVGGAANGSYLEIRSRTEDLWCLVEGPGVRGWASCLWTRLR